MINGKTQNPMPPNKTDEDIANEFANHFRDKIEKIRSKLTTTRPCTPKAYTGGSRLSRIFWEHENQSSLLVIRLIYIKLYRKMENKFWKKNLG